MNKSPFITVIIKTYNEQAGIAKTISSVRAAMGHYPYKIIVADSLSTDETAKVAIEAGATVVSLVHAHQRCCGIGHQLGYQYSEGDYLLLLDGDMELEAGFVDSAVSFLQQNSAYAGVAGRVEMDEASNYEFESRKQRLNSIYPTGDVDHLAGGGLYRRSAIETIGYLTNRNLHAYEEAELGIRLQSAGFKLHRLDIPYFFHTSYDLSTFELLKRRWKSKYLCGPGELIRSSLGQPYCLTCVKKVKNEVIFASYLLVVLLGFILLSWPMSLLLLTPLALFFTLKSIRNRSMVAASFSVINLTLYSAGLVRGLIQPTVDPAAQIESKVMNDQENV
ncbi:glycosyltransferase [Vibrio litoralis]|uniref:glycosyltransferase n=1 Tax=Vibrio litoralis TaxID=335972 RepID=UPI00040F913A|nr:glycosyltransferase [Vibrio litoralis]